LGRIVVLGGGLSGLAAAWRIAGAGVGPVTLVERGNSLGGLAGSFEHEGAHYPLGYHHILPTDETLIRFLERIGALADVEWRRIRMLFRLDGNLYDFSRPGDFVRLPLPAREKARFVKMMLWAYRKEDWSDWHGRSAAELIDTKAGSAARDKIFEPLCRLKFEMPSQDVSAAWLGSRLHAREGSGRLGYIPGANWTKTLCDGMARLVAERGVEVRTGIGVARLSGSGGRVHQVGLENGDVLDADVVVSAMPTDVLARLLPDESQVDSIGYSALLSLVCGVCQEIPDDFYWLNLLSPKQTACGLFLLSALNPTIGREGEHCVNFVTHLRGADQPLYRASEDELMAHYVRDYRDVFGLTLQPDWVHLSRIRTYSPIFGPAYRNPDIRSPQWNNLYLTGNYRTYPSVASTGTALRSGLETAGKVIADRQQAPPARPTSRWWSERRAKVA
jgi:protoporphyrinogen oxidase